MEPKVLTCSLYGKLGDINAQTEVTDELERLLAEYSTTVDAVQEFLQYQRVPVQKGEPSSP